MRIVFSACGEAAYGQFPNVASLQFVDLWGRVDLHLKLAATTRVMRDLSGPLPTLPALAIRPFRKRYPELSKSNCVRPSLTAEVNASVHTVAHRNGTPPASGTQSQGLPEWRSPGCRIGPPAGFPVPSRTHPQGGVPCRTCIRTNVAPHKPIPRLREPRPVVPSNGGAAKAYARRTRRAVVLREKGPR